MAEHIFEDLIVLEIANNHWGDVHRGLRIVDTYADIADRYDLRVALKLQFRHPVDFVHHTFRDRTDIRYPQKCVATALRREDFQRISERIKDRGCLLMATPFDEYSVETCAEARVDVLKIASAQLDDLPLLQESASLNLPIAVSTGGASLSTADRTIEMLSTVPRKLAVNHCVSIYPSQPEDLNLGRIELLRKRYPHCTIGFSTHEQDDWSVSIGIAYALGARVFERHVDIDEGTFPVSAYCSLPSQIERWIEAFLLAKKMMTKPSNGSAREREYLDTLVRGVYARNELHCNDILTSDNVFFAIPAQPGQLTVRDEFTGARISEPVRAGSPIPMASLDWTTD